MAGSKLDPIDRQILAELQADGRMTNVELASRVGISAPPCLRRVRTLEEAGFIRGYHADIDARELGFEVQVFAMVRLKARPRPTFRPSRRAAAPGRWCANVTC
jgi:DNA-binding Lrp family transcriptional regulator